jgi:hypothetical protein
MSEVKRCRRCQVVKPVTAFYPRHSKDGYALRPRPQCKDCENRVRIEKRAASGKKTCPSKSHPRRVYAEPPPAPKPSLNALALWPPAQPYILLRGPGQPLARIRANADKIW